MTSLKPLGARGRERAFGKFAFKHTPLPGNPEKIAVTDDWAERNLLVTRLPDEIAALPGADVGIFHRLVAPHFKLLVDAWFDANVDADILSWGGSYAARYVRGSAETLSSHAWGSAFDINVTWNGLGKEPARLGTKGTVLRLVPIAESLGWYWGGNFTRKDGMHFEFVGTP